MATTRQVKCINKRDRQSRHERISHIGGDWGLYGARIKITEEQAISDIENNIFIYFVQIGTIVARLIIATHLGRKYLKTETDSTTVDNLLSLPECY
jgi:hypothetical protein